MNKSENYSRKKTIQSGIVKWVSVVLAPFILLLVLLNWMTYQVSAERVKESLQNTLQLQAYGVGNQLEEVENSIQRLYGDNAYYLLVLQNYSGEMDTYLSRQEIYSQMTRYTLASSAEEALFLYAPGTGQYLMAYPENTYTEYVALRAYLEERLTPESNYSSAAWEVVPINDTYYVMCFRRMNGLWLGSCAKVGAVMNAMLESQTGLLQETHLFLEMRGEYYQIQPGSVTKSIQTPDGTLITARDDRGNFTLALQPRTSLLAFSGSAYIWVLLAFSVLLVSLLPLFLGKISRKITAPVKALEEGMRVLQKGNFEFQLEENCYFREMEDIKETFNEMIGHIKILKNDIYEEKLLRQKTESDFLQMQVKPHFYLNSLNQIHILAEMGDADTISRLSGYLVRYFRYLLRADQKLVPLQDELQQIRDFLSIQEMRYPAGFRYDCQTAPGLEKLLLPPLLLLTFVENSLKYALSIYGEFRLSITVQKLGSGFCRICIEDSGQGFPDSVLHALGDGREVRTPDGRTCIGISNARQRLVFAFGKAASIRFTNESALGGARIVLLLPHTET